MSITNYDGHLEAMASYCKAMYENTAKVNNAYHDSVENAYAKALPSGYVDVLDIKKIGGKTLVWNQLVDTGTTEVATISGRKYYALINGTASIVTADGTAITVADDTTDMVVDLTLCFGKGNEPATISDFTKVFPSAHYSYNEGMLLSAGVTSVVSKDSSDNTLQTISIPDEVQELKGYGWSAGSVYNYVDFERKVFVQNVGKITINAEKVYAYGSPGTNCTCYCIYKPSGAKEYDSGVVVNGFVPTTWHSPIDDAGNVGNVTGGYAGNYYIFGFSPSTTLEQAKAALGGKNLLYPLTTPVETDISAYLTDNKGIETAAGGSLTFESQHGDDYKIPVPVGLEYIGVS